MQTWTWDIRHGSRPHAARYRLRLCERSAAHTEGGHEDSTGEKPSTFICTFRFEGLFTAQGKMPGRAGEREPNSALPSSCPVLATWAPSTLLSVSSNLAVCRTLVDRHLQSSGGRRCDGPVIG